ncbi:MAG: ABC transporter substrate-binding protein [Pseudonocardiaceae bacterium]
MIRGSFSAPNVEDIIAAKPELAIGNVRTHSKIRDAIASVAPMYLIATAAYPDTFRQLTDLGKLTGREAQAAAAIQRFKDKITAVKVRSPGNLVALLVYGEPGSPGGFAINTDNSTAGSVVAEITKYPWKVPPGVQDNGPGAYLYSLEQVLTVDPDVIIYEQFGSDDKLADKVVNNPVYRQLKAVKNHRLLTIDATYPETAQDTLGMEIFLDQVAPLLYPSVFPSAQR